MTANVVIPVTTSHTHTRASEKTPRHRFYYCEAQSKAIMADEVRTMVELWDSVGNDCAAKLEPFDRRAAQDVMLQFRNRLGEWLQGRTVSSRSSLRQLRLLPASMEKFQSLVNTVTSGHGNTHILLGSVCVALKVGWLRIHRMPILSADQEEVSQEVVKHCPTSTRGPDVLVRLAEQIEIISDKLDGLLACHLVDHAQAFRPILDIYTRLVSFFTEVIICLRQVCDCKRDVCLNGLGYLHCSRQYGSTGLDKH